MIRLRKMMRAWWQRKGHLCGHPIGINRSDGDSRGERDGDEKGGPLWSPAGEGYMALFLEMSQGDAGDASVPSLPLILPRPYGC